MSLGVIIDLPPAEQLTAPLERQLSPEARRGMTKAAAYGVVVLWKRNFLALSQHAPFSPGRNFRSIHADPFFRGVHNRKMNQMEMRETSTPQAPTQKSTGFWMGAAMATQYSMLGDTSAKVSVNQVGVRLRFLGGTVVAKDKLLTIPAIPEAVGTNAEDWAYLVFEPMIHGPKTVGALVDYYSGEVVFWLSAETTHEPDPNVIPLEETGREIDRQINEWLARN